jgi:hypothetical protein
MTVTGGPGESGGPGRFVLGFALTVAAGISVFVVIAMFTASGQAHLFAEGAVLTGIGTGVVVLVLRAVARLPLGELIGLAAFMALFDDFFGW